MSFFLFLPELQWTGNFIKNEVANIIQPEGKFK